MDQSKPSLRKLAAKGENILLETKILLEIEAEVRESWEEKVIFVNADQSCDSSYYPSDEPGDDPKKWFENYLFGGLSVRTFLIAKLECCAAYHRLRDDSVPWHIKASGAEELPDRIIHQLVEEPPVFPTVWRAAYSTDAMRLSLACACDGANSPRILFNIANCVIRKLTKEMSWISEQVGYLAAAADSFSSFVRRIRRDGPPSTFADKAFANEINIAVHRTNQYYKACMFQDALISGFLQLQAARDWYRISCGPHGMNHDLVRRYIDVHTRLIAPICPHYAEYVWREHLKKDSFVVLKSGWPAADAPDLILESANKYLQDLIDFMRELENKFLALNDCRHNVTEEAKKAVGLIYVREEYDGWEEKCLRVLQDNFDSETNHFYPDDEDLLKALESSIYEDFTSRRDVDYRQTAKYCIPFLKQKKVEALRFGVEALELKLPFKEVEVLEENLDLIKREIRLDEVKIQVLSGANDFQDFTLDSPPTPGRPAAALVSRDFYEKMECSAPGVWELKAIQLRDDLSYPPFELLFQEKMEHHPLGLLLLEKMEHCSAPEEWNSEVAQFSDDVLAPLYLPPFELTFQGTFEKAKHTASVEDKWLLVNLQSTVEFSSHLLNRDTWANEAVSKIISANFIFWQAYDDTNEGRKVCTDYALGYTPAVLIVDPIDGQNLRLWYGMVQPECLLEDLLVPFLGNSPKYHHCAALSRSCSRVEISLPPPEEIGDETADEGEAELQQALVASMESMHECDSTTSCESELNNASEEYRNKRKKNLEHHSDWISFTLS